MISVLILTLNEEKNLPDCLASVTWSDDIVVLDSFSTDRTVAIAAAAGARVVQRQFDEFASQRNYALDEITFRNPWVFHLDADERFTEPLRLEAEAAAKRDRFSGFLVPSKTIFMGRWLRWAGLYPSYQMRLLKVGEVRFVQKGHGQQETDAQRGISRLREPYLHYNFSKGLDEWLAKHARYSLKEAEETLRQKAGRRLPWADLICADVVRRRRALKALSALLPFRPALRFFYMYVLRLGVLDGRAGLRYCCLLALYESMIVNAARQMSTR
jgi:glycosyltransferase involved in cell wall biosynthesis